MSFVPAVSQRDGLVLFGAVAAVVVLGVVLRRGSTGPPASSASGPPLSDDEGPDRVDDPGEEQVGADAFLPDEDEMGAGTLAVTSDGWAFMPGRDRDRIELIPPPARPGMGLPNPAPDQLKRGDLIAARVTRGAPDHDPWRLEGLGRDHEFRAWRFETEEAAKAARELVDRCVVRAPRDEDGVEIAIMDADFAEARRREEEIETELATMADVDEPSDGPPPRPFA